jgi:adenosine kinase
MLEYARLYKILKVPYIFDPGQQLTSFSGAELKKMIKGSKVLIGNDYEIKLISDKTGLSVNQLEKLTEILVITSGAKGSQIYTKNKKINIKAVKIKKIVDPTGAGDAYRAGFISGLLMSNDLREAGQLGSLIGAYAVEHQGTQTHNFSLKEFKKRYKNNYK